MNKKKSAIYKRLSEEDDNLSEGEKETSLINQELRARDWAKNNDREIIEPVYNDEYLSGSDRSRPAFLKLIEDAKQGKFQEIIVDTRSRFCRDPAFFLDTMSRLTARGIKVWAYVDNRYLDESSYEDQFGSVVDGFAIIEGKKAFKKTLDLFKIQGKPMQNPCYGYKWSNKKWIIEKDKANIVRQIFKSINEIPPKKPTELANQFNISIDIVKRIIKNKKIYEGFIIFKKYIKDNDGYIRDSKGKYIYTLEEYKGVHEPII